MTHWRIASVGVLSLAFVLGTHWLMTAAPASPWNAVGVLAPMLLAAALGAWQGQQRWLALLLLGLAAALAACAALNLPLPMPLLYLGQHVVVHAMLGLWFASTLRDGARPLISVMAAQLHGTLSPALARYTRNVTRAWVAYFAAMVLLSLLLFATAPFEAWATFANLLTPLALATMFIGERGLRYRLHPEFERTSLADAVRAYRLLDSAAPLAPPRDLKE